MAGVSQTGWMVRGGGSQTDRRGRDDGAGWPVAHRGELRRTACRSADARRCSAAPRLAFGSEARRRRRRCWCPADAGGAGCAGVGGPGGARPVHLQRRPSAQPSAFGAARAELERYCQGSARRKRRSCCPLCGTAARDGGGFATPAPVGPPPGGSAGRARWSRRTLLWRRGGEAGLGRGGGGQAGRWRARTRALRPSCSPPSAPAGAVSRSGPARARTPLSAGPPGQHHASRFGTKSNRKCRRSRGGEGHTDSLR
jgi:hypothetical protein